jgi:hypothetical protein
MIARPRKNPLHDLITAAGREFPSASRAEIAHALCIDEKVVGLAFRKAEFLPRDKVMRKREGMIRAIEAFAEMHAGGAVDIEMVAGVGSKLKVNGVVA